jgi:MoxR-like ATPase
MDWITAERGQSREERWRSLPKPAVTQLYGPENYIADESIIEAINTAILLGQPLFLTGEPGCGKTEVGNFIAWKLGLGDALRFDVKSTTSARDLFYIPDTIGRFHAAHEGSRSVDPLRFITFQAFGRAILYANEPSAVESFLPTSQHPGRRRSVVLIDEIDKAPLDVPNDLLMEIENMQFYVSEIPKTISADTELRPIVIITSNSERILPNAFLRRCVYYDIPFPGAHRLKEIALARIRELPASSDLLGDALLIFYYIRGLAFQKKPGTAEFLSFILALRARGYRTEQTLRGDDSWHSIASYTLVKDKGEQAQAFRRFEWPKAVI